MKLFKIILFAIFCLLAMPCFAQNKGKKNSNTQPYPYGNPIIHHMYTADAAPHVMPDGRVWMVTSVDSENGGGYSTMHEYHTFSSADMVTWTDHGTVFNIKDVAPDSVGTALWALWAPDMIYRNGKYYLYYPVRILYPDSLNANGGKVVKTYIGVAVSDAPDKQFKVLNPKMQGTSGIDPAVFADDDGEVYLYWGSHNAAKLKENMSEFATKPLKLDVDTDRFMEAIWMNKRAGKYYVSYHTKYDNNVKGKRDDPDRPKSELAYSVGDNPLGPFKYVGTFNYELGVNVKNGPRNAGQDFVPWRLTQSNHGGIVEFHGQEYLFYHTSALSSWRQDTFKAEGTWTQRSVCVDKLDYNPDGTIIPVQQTIEGVPSVKINQPFDILLDKQTLTISDKQQVLEYKNIALGTGYYYFGLTAHNVKKTIRAEIHLDKPDGLLIGTVRIDKDGIGETFLRNAKGNHTVFIVFKGETGAYDLTVSDLHFFAGSPKSK